MGPTKPLSRIPSRLNIIFRVFSGTLLYLMGFNYSAGSFCDACGMEHGALIQSSMRVNYQTLGIELISGTASTRFKGVRGFF